MSDSDPRLPERPSLEHLRKRAKDRLRALRDEKPEAKLAEAQLEIARDLGFPSWPALVRHVHAENPPGLAHYDELARLVAAAYTENDYAGVRRINHEYGTGFRASREPAVMHGQLPSWAASADRPFELALTDARHLVARKAGFESWVGLIEGLGEPRAAAGASPPAESFYRIDRDRSALTVQGPLSDALWDTVASVMAAEGIDDLTCPGMTDAGMERVSRLGHVRRLAADGAQLTDEGLTLLARLPELRALAIGGPASVLTDRGLEVLRHLPELREFEMPWAPRITDRGAAWLRHCPRLTHVRLAGTATGDGVIAALAGMRELRVLATGRLVTDAGLALLRDLPVFRSWQGGAMSYSLMTQDVAPNHLHLDGPFTDEGAAALRDLEGLFGLTLFWHTTQLTPAVFGNLSALQRLGHLRCDEELCDDTAMEHISRFPGLRMLIAQGSVATDAGFAALSRSATLEHFWGRECPNLTGAGFAALSRMPALRGLGVSCKNVDETSLATLPRFPELRVLVPMDVTDDGFRYVGQCEKLEELWCMYCRETGDAATEHVRGLRKLRSYYASYNRITDRSLEMLAGMTSLESVTLEGIAGVTNRGLGALAALPRLREVSVEGLAGVTRDVLASFPPSVHVRYTG